MVAVAVPMSPGSAAVPVMIVLPILVMPALDSTAKFAVVPKGGAWAWLELGTTAVRPRAARNNLRERVRQVLVTGSLQSLMPRVGGTQDRLDSLPSQRLETRCC